MNQPPLNPDALEAMSREIAPNLWEIIDRHHDNPRTPDYRKYVLAKAEKLASDYLAAAQPEVTSVEELDQLPVGSVVRGGVDDLVGEKIRFNPYLPHWCTIGEEVEADKRDLLPARVLYRPSEQP